MGPVLGNDDHGDPLSPENPKKKKKKIHFLIIPQGASVAEIDKTDLKIKQKKIELLQEATGLKANQVPIG